MTILSTSAQKIQDVLRENGSSASVIEFSESTRTAQEAADQVGCQLGQIVKSMIFKGQQSGSGILVLTSGINRVEEKKIGGYVGESVGRADPDFVHTTTGFAIGGVPPIGLASPMKTFLDEDLLQYPTVWAAAGAPRAVFEIATSDLVEMTGAIVACVKST